MFEIIDVENSRWDKIVTSFSEYDVYYQRGYLKGFEIHGDGHPLLLYYDGNGLRGICAVLRRETAFEGEYDIITPYGYGGFIFEGNVSEENMEAFKKSFYDSMKENNIISAFFRYHPLLNNAELVRSIFPVIDLGKTIDIDLESEQKIFDNLSSKNRNHIRKALKNGVSIGYGKGMDLFMQFIPIYNSTMDRDEAAPYYYFSEEFYGSIDKSLNNNYLIFYAQYEGKILAASIIFFANKFIHYHLSGSLPEYRHIAPTNLLLYEVALWGTRNGFERFHLGGGVGAGEDNLYKFKESFNRNSSNQFSIGKMIFDQDKYDKLVADRIQKDPEFNAKSPFFPLYRA